MRAAHSNLAFAVLLAVSPVAGSAAAAASMRVAGSGGFVEAMQQVGPPFTAATGIELQVITGLGTAGAMRALADGVIDAVFAAREPHPSEAKGQVVSRAFARTPLAFVTSHRKPNGWKSSDIPALFVAQNPKWEDGSPLRIILRTRVDADTVLAGWYIPGLAEAIEQARSRADVPVAATDQDNVTIAQGLVGSLTFAGLGQITAEKTDLRLVAIDGVMPSLANLANGTYPYEKTFYLVFLPDRSANAEKLLQFLQSAEGRKIMQALGYLPPSD